MFSIHLWTMDWFIDSQHLFLIALVVIIISLMRMTVQRVRNTTAKQQEREEAIQTAREVERKRQLDALLPKAKVTSPRTRLPQADPFGTPFTGNVHGRAAKWEAEIHQIGRQIIGQIDSKMSALQAVTLEANRTANRLEILLEHLEQIAQKQIEQQQRQLIQNTPTDSAEAPPAVISAEASASEAAPLTEVLQELTTDLDGIRRAIRQSTTFGEPPEHAAVLRLPEPQETPAAETPANLRGEVEMLSNYGLEPQEIARRLNISIGEVDLMLQVQQNQLNRTM